MKIHSTPIIRDFVFGLSLAAVALLFTGGCVDSDSSEANSTDAAAEALARLDFHKPKTLNNAVVRLREIHDAIAADSPFPEPLKFKVVEVIHGTGTGAHSHFYLADSDYKSHDDHHDEEMESAEKFHEIEVGPVAEFRDIAKWLPKIATKTPDIEEETWNAVKQLATKIRDATEDIDLQADAESLRSSFREKTDLSDLINQLESKTNQSSIPDQKNC